MEKEQLEKLKQKYIPKEKLIIARVVRKTIKYIEKNIDNFPKTNIVLKNRIMESLYDMLEYVYRANILQDINDKKEIIVKIEMLNFYFETALNSKLISKKKFESFTKYLIEIDKMTRSWVTYEASK